MSDGKVSLEDTAAAQFETGRLHVGAGGCPISKLGEAFNPFAGEFLEDPYRFLQTARRDEAVFYSPEIDHWVVTKYSDVREVFENPGVFGAANTLSAVTPMSPKVGQILRDSGFRMNPVLTNLDPPDHARIRKHAVNSFSTRRVAESEGWIREVVDLHIDRLLAHARGADGLRHADLVKDFAYDLPAHVVVRFLGVPEEDIANIKAWTRNRVMLTWGRCDESAQLAEVDGLIAMWKFCERLVEGMLQGDRPGFIGSLVEFHLGNPSELSVNEIESILFTMLVAGHETTTNALASSFVTLLEDPARWAALAEDPSLIPNVVEEMLRYRPSIIAWRRIAKEEASIGTVRVPKGGRVLLMLASANHDESQFPEPHTVNFGRHNAKRHVAFGHGVHLCIGAGLARLEMRVVLEQMALRIPGLRLDSPQEFEYLPNLSFRGPARVRVQWP
ncbi:MAG: hypothetical protein RLZZ200_1018 [Pseudomonadota bacterium]|jgi:cytochrome P450